MRDLQGRLRLVVKTARDTAEKLRRLEQTLIKALGSYFLGPVLSTAAGNRDEARLAAKLLELSQPWAPRISDQATGLEVEAARSWRKLERRLTKQVWLEDSKPSPPWELGSGPAIVTFYSFKGGVGRTTALASCAWQLAKRGQRVAVIDLDLEGPGLGALLGAEAPYGVVDFLVDHLATDSRSLAGMTSIAQAFGEDGAKVTVLPAGRLDAGYLEKLARLDFISSIEEKSPLERALEALLHAVRRDLDPEYVLIDSRSGLHDLAGLSLHGLAHVDVFFTRASNQSYAGLELALQTLGKRRGPEGLLPVIVHAFTPADVTSRLYEEEAQEVLERSYDFFCRYVYDTEPPALEAKDASHYPWRVRTLTALERFSSLLGIEMFLLSEDYQVLLGRILELTMREDEEVVE